MIDSKVTRVTYSKPSCLTVEAREENLWKTMEVMDKMHRLAEMTAAIGGWLKMHPGKTLADLEALFRAARFHTTLIAIHYSQDPQFKVQVESGDFEGRMVSSDGESKESTPYVLWTSCRPPPFGENELLTYRFSREENTELLAKTGFMTCVTKEAPDKLPSHEKFGDNQASDLALLGEGRLIPVLEETTLGTIFQKDTEGKNFSMAIVGMGPSGPVAGAVSSSGKLLSRIGIMGEEYISF